MISDPLYNSRLMASLSNLEHDFLGLQHMSHFLEVLSVLIDVVGHDHLSCSALLFKSRYKMIVGDIEEVVKEEDVVIER